MKIYLILCDSDDYGGTFSGSITSVIRAFRHKDHALKVKRSLAHQKEYKESDLTLAELDLED